MVNQFLIRDQHAVFTERISYFIPGMTLIFHGIISECNRCYFVCHFKLNTFRHNQKSTPFNALIGSYEFNI